ncbi:hypothetical protein AVEN_195935-1 [Araneus ventricosus]|uniref:Uncharacterized protein n=1 Tax=Araneus ventricosus TaxID=182803 RepID=A0A4Y2I8B4_ARAVE|nr:hypothetical protein AVEN_195935-1 [Araneus ventricosus]
MNDMKKYLSIKEKKHGEKELFIYKKVDDKKARKNEDKKESCKKLSKLEELRAKRLKRETEEKQRAQKFLESFRKGPSQPEPVILDDRARQYNSQFNPHLARNNFISPKNYHQDY